MIDDMGVNTCSCSTLLIFTLSRIALSKLSSADLLGNSYIDIIPIPDFRSTHSNICHIADFIILKYVISDKNYTNESYLDIFSVRGQQSVTLDECYCKCLF